MDLYDHGNEIKSEYAEVHIIQAYLWTLLCSFVSVNVSLEKEWVSLARSLLHDDSVSFLVIGLRIALLGREWIHDWYLLKGILLCPTTSSCRLHWRSRRWVLRERTCWVARPIKLAKVVAINLTTLTNLRQRSLWLHVLGGCICRVVGWPAVRLLILIGHLRRGLSKISWPHLGSHCVLRWRDRLLVEVVVLTRTLETMRSLILHSRIIKRLDWSQLIRLQHG